MTEARGSRLARNIGLRGATMMGLGSMVGTGVFVSLGLAVGLVGPAVTLALLLAGLLALCNGISSAQLAAAHPMSGGTYEYGYRFLNPWIGYVAGWLFICAKCASAATAAIGFGGYFLHLFSIEVLAPWQIGLMVTIVVVIICLLGIRRSSFSNITIVTVTLFALTSFVVILAGDFKPDHLQPFFAVPLNQQGPLAGLLEATALMFVAYTGYGRIATLGEEVSNPTKNIPIAIFITLAVSFVLYLAVAAVSLGAVGSASYYKYTVSSAAPLEQIATQMSHPILASLMAIGAMTAMLGVLLNLVLGISRVVFAMGKRGDFPSIFGEVSVVTRSPHWGIVGTGIVICLLIFLKDVKLTWSFSAFTVLCYYAITNFAALKLPLEKRIYSPLFAWIGLMGCLGLGVFVDLSALLLGGTLLVLGIVWRIIFRMKFILK